MDEEGKRRDEIPCQVRAVNAEYFQLCKIACLQGSLFNDSVPEANNYKIIINETAARLFGFKNPIRQKTETDIGEIHFIAGVVKDTSRQVEPLVYFYDQAKLRILYRYHPGTKQEVEKKVRELMLKKAPGHLISFSYTDELIESQNRTEINFLTLLYLLSFICMAIAALLAAIIVLRIWKSVHRTPVQELRKE